MHRGRRITNRRALVQQQVTEMPSHPINLGGEGEFCEELGTEYGGDRQIFRGVKYSA